VIYAVWLPLGLLAAYAIVASIWNLHQDGKSDRAIQRELKRKALLDRKARR
jgi:hypothetical protein